MPTRFWNSFALSARPALLTIALLCTFFLLPSVAMGQDAPPLDGYLVVEWGDQAPGVWQPGTRRVLLAVDGEHRLLEVSDDLFSGGVYRWNGRYVRIFPRINPAFLPDGEPLPVAAAQLIREPGETATPSGAGVSGMAVNGTQPWVSILCKFSDFPDEPEPLAYFQNMYGNSGGRLDHYWREVSANTIDIVGSIAIDWVDLPHPQIHYAPTPRNNFNADLDALFDDCTTAADPFIDFSNGGAGDVVGVNMVFNEWLDCCAWGGTRWATLDGVTKVWRVTWMPIWAWDDLAVWAHEMGHGFGLPHSTNWDDDGNPYDSPKDVMSSATTESNVDASYGNLGKHTIAYHKDFLGWIPDNQEVTVPVDSSTTVTLDHRARNTTPDVRHIVVPIGNGSTWYSIEAINTFGSYESAFLQEAVLIHQIDPNRGEPAWLVDADMPPADFSNNEGSIWRAGETFVDAANNITVSVNSQTAHGFVVTVTSGDPGETIFTDGFESGSLTAWSSVVQ